MADRYGKLPVPVPPVQAGGFPPVTAIGDPLLGYAADFIKAILNSYCQEAWRSVQPAYPPVKVVVLDDPTEESFLESQLPAIFVFREPGQKDEQQWWEADDYRFHRSRLVVWWVMPPAEQAVRKRRYAITDAAAKMLDRAIERERDPAWKVPGDTDALAATLGSSFATWGGWTVFTLEHHARTKMTVPMAAPAPGRNYLDALKMTFTVEEQWVRDVNDISDPDNQLKATYVSPDQGTGLGDFDLGDAIYE